jgi:hypothetical protein
MQAKPLFQIYKVLLKILFLFLNLLLIVLKGRFEFYKIICLGLNGFETILKKLQKNGKQK